MVQCGKIFGGVCFFVGVVVDVGQFQVQQFVFGDVVGYVYVLQVLGDQEYCVVDDGVGECDLQDEQCGGDFVLVQCGEDGKDVYWECFGFSCFLVVGWV